MNGGSEAVDVSAWTVTAGGTTWPLPGGKRQGAGRGEGKGEEGKVWGGERCVLRGWGGGGGAPRVLVQPLPENYAGLMPGVHTLTVW